MDRHRRTTAALIAPCLAWACFAGCAGEPAEPEAPQADATLPDDVFAEPVGGEVVLTAEEIANIEKLPAEDRALALAQKVCPISGEPLGTPAMGVPVKVDAAGTPVFVCCAGCTGAVEDDPEAALAELGLEPGGSEAGDGEEDEEGGGA